MGAELPSKGHGTGITICSSHRNLRLMYSPARSRRLCCLFKHLEHVAGSDGSLIVPGLEHGTQQAGNVPRASSQHRGWARMTPTAPSPEMPSPAGRDGARLPRALQQTPGGAGAGPVLGEPSCLPPRRSTCALRGAAGFRRSPWQPELGASPWLVVCFQPPRSSWQPGCSSLLLSGHGELSSPKQRAFCTARAPASPLLLTRGCNVWAGRSARRCDASQSEHTASTPCKGSSRSFKGSAKWDKNTGIRHRHVHEPG